MLSIKNLTLGYGENILLHGISAAAAAGELIMLAGRNGSGKSTLLRAVTGLAKPLSGRILADGKDISAISRNEAAQYINTYFEKYPEIKTYMAQTIEFAKQHDYVLTPMGRRCFIKGFDSSRTRGFAERAAINAPIQGGAADLIKLAMIQVMNRLKEEKIPAELLLQIHDELIFEVPEESVEKARLLIQSTMEQVAKLSIPLIVDVGVGHSWKDAH